MRRFFVMILLAVAAPSLLPAQVVVNEIMYAPDPPEPEWVELYNVGTAEADLSGWRVHDAGGGNATVAAGSIPPGGYLVLTRDSTRLRDVRPAGVPIIQVQLPSLNNAGDAVILRNGSGATVDSVHYTEEWGGAAGEGASLERRNHTDRGTDDSSWGRSVDRSGATPGRRNSLSPAEFDLLVESPVFDQAETIVAATIRNAGTRGSAAAVAVLYHDADEDGSGAATEELLRREVDAIPPGGSVTVRFKWPREPTEQGEMALVEIRSGDDQRIGNNTLSVTVRSPFPETGVFITEIMFDPLPAGARAGAEYVELYNGNGVPIGLAGWKLYDATGRAQATLPARTPRVPPRGRLLVASDSTIFSRFPALRDSSNLVLIGISSFGLNAEGDEVILRNGNGGTVDSVSYLPEWHRPDLGEMKGVALEKISAGGASADRRSWSSSAAPSGGTPGVPNSVEIPPSSSGADIFVQPPVISPDGDGYEDFTRISYRLPTRNARIVATVFDRSGRPVRRLASNEPASAEGELIWDGRDQNGRPLPPGIYPVRLEAYDDGGGGLFEAQGTVIVARKF